ncbi:hypothetical protein SLE2022_160560 [Rubroshorea leprosula]
MQTFELLSGDPSKEDEGFRFENSLQELRELRSQLHYAADYCETTFRNSEEKRAVVENTKEYIRKAVVTFVDHLGNVSANLNRCIAVTNEFSDAELRIDCLRQRLLSSQLYAEKLALMRVQWSAYSPKHHRRYLSTCNYNNHPSDGIASNCAKRVDKRELDMPLFLYTSTNISSSPLKNTDKCDSDLAPVPVGDGISVLSRSSNPNFHFQTCPQKLGRRSFYRKAWQNPDILSILQRAKNSSNMSRTFHK